MSKYVIIVAIAVLLTASAAFADVAQINSVTVGAGGQYDCPASAMDDLSAWCVNPSANNRCVMKIEPGTYDVTATGGLRMRPYVDIVGSGADQTVIRGEIGGYGKAVVSGASDATLGSLTVENSGGGQYALAIYNRNCAPAITDVHASASGSRSNSAIYNDNASPVLNNVRAVANGGVVSYGVRNINASNPVISGGSFSAAGADENFGIFNIGSSEATIEQNCLVEGSSAQIATVSEQAFRVYQSLDIQVVTDRK